MLRILSAALLGIVLSSLPAFALSPREATKVVELLEKLESEHGMIAYDEEEAGQIFEDDREGLIEKAGFSRESWKTAFDAVMQGNMALVPQSEVDATLKEIEARFKNATGLPPEQMAAIKAMYDEQVAIILAYREKGREHMDVVRPLAERLEPLVMPDSN